MLYVALDRLLVGGCLNFFRETFGHDCRSRGRDAAHLRRGGISSQLCWAAPSRIAERKIGVLCEEGYLTRHSPNGAGAIERAYPHYFFRIYEKTPKADKLLLGNSIEPIKQTISRQFWHQVLMDDILLSIEAACNFDPATAIFNGDRIQEGELNLLSNIVQVLEAFQNGVENTICVLTESITAQQLEQLASLMDQKKCESVQIF